MPRPTTRPSRAHVPAAPAAIAQDAPDVVAQETADLDDRLGVAVAERDAPMLRAVDTTPDRIEEDGTPEQIVETWIPVQEN